MPIPNLSSFLDSNQTGNLLRDDDSLLRQIFFSVLRHHHPNLANKVDVIYALSQAWCNSNSDQDFELLESYLSALKPEETILVRNWGSAMGLLGSRGRIGAGEGAVGVGRRALGRLGWGDGAVGGDPMAATRHPPRCRRRRSPAPSRTCSTCTT